MKEFLKEVLVFNSKFKQVKINKFVIQNIQDIALQLLNLKDLNQLRDKYEGAAFLKRLQKDIMSAVAIEKVLELKLIDWDKRKKIKDLPSEIIIGEITYGIITFEFGEYPVYIDANEKRPLIFCYLKGQDTIVVCGYASLEIIENNHEINENITFVASDKVIFKGFDKLLPLDSLI